MNWSAISFDWNQVRAFLATAEEGSLSAAARALGQTQPTISRQVSALEETLGVVLFERGPRTMALTGPGVALLEHVRAMAEAAMRLSITASGTLQAVDGRVTITAGDMLSAYLLPDILARIAEEAPRLVLDLVTSNEVRDLVRRDADIAVRHVAPSEGVLIARRLPSSTAYLCASKDYLERHGEPSGIDDLGRFRFVGLSPMERYLPTLAAQGLRIGLEHVGVTVSNGATAIALVRRGLGIGIIPDYAAAANPDLVPILKDRFQVEVPMWIVAHRELHTSRRIRLVFDALAEGISSIGSSSRAGQPR